jgi:uncharacterized membrane protein
MVTASAEISTMRSGPLPEAQEYERYESTLPGAAERLMKMAETQSLHRQELEKAVIRSNIRDSLLGIVCGFCICVVTIVCGTIAILNGHDWPGALLGGSGIVGLASVFVYGTRSSKRELAEKKRDMS